MNSRKIIKVLFICMGNICRSPTAEGVFRHVVEESGVAGSIIIDSAGTHAYHVGNPPDPRSQQAGLGRGFDLSAQVARQVEVQDFSDFDHILAMDYANYRELMVRCPAPYQEKVELFLNYHPDGDVTEVPDPYYGEGNGFESVLDLIETASQSFLDEIRSRYNL